MSFGEDLDFTLSLSPSLSLLSSELSESSESLESSSDELSESKDESLRGGFGLVFLKKEFTKKIFIHCI